MDSTPVTADLQTSKVDVHCHPHTKIAVEQEVKEIYLICFESLLILVSTYLLVVPSPFSAHSGLECILLCHRSDGISPFASVTSQRDI